MPRVEPAVARLRSDDLAAAGQREPLAVVVRAQRDDAEACQLAKARATKSGELVATSPTMRWSSLLLVLRQREPRA
jgi:hypothetical protein